VYQKNFSVREIKTILIDLDVNVVPLLTGQLYSTVQANAAFPDQENVYTGVYVGSYLHKDGTGPSVRDVVRIANILRREKSILGVIEPLKLGEKTIEAAKMLGECWKHTLEEIDSWVQVSEVDNYSDSEDGDEMSQEIPEEEPRGEGSVPFALRFACFAVDFPYTPYYVGYGKTPETRWAEHKRRTMPSIPLMIVSRGRNGVLSSLNHVVNWIIDYIFPSEYLVWRPTLIWTSWHLNHRMGQVAPPKSH
jgi:hypothetical protein